MDVKITKGKGEITAFLNGEIDHHTARDIRQQIDSAAEAHHPKVLYLDFSGVRFMDSSGIGLIMGRYRLMQLMGGYVRVINIPSHLQRLIELSGVKALGVLSGKEVEV